MTNPPDVQEVARRFRAELTRGQSGTNRRLARLYAGVWSSVRADLDALQERILEARAEGEITDEDTQARLDAWLTRQAQYVRFLEQLEAQLRLVAPSAVKETDALTVAALAAASRHAAEAEALVTEAAPIDVTGLGTLNARAAIQAAALLSGGRLRKDPATGQLTLQGGGPLVQLFEDRAGEAAAKAKAVLFEGIARGWSPHKTAQALKRATVDGEFTNALTVARTEQMRAYREATRLEYLATDKVGKWYWSSRLSVERTCSFCWAQHGTLHPLTQPMATHPNCMCVMLPWVDDSDLDFTPEEIADGAAPLDYGPTGPDRFAKLAASEQDGILGPAAGMAYRAKAFQLPDVIHTERSDKGWGPTGHAKPLAKILGPSDAATWVGKARAAGVKKAAATRATKAAALATRKAKRTP